MNTPHKGPDYGDFSLSSVCWGYRETFARAIEGLYEQGLLGEENEAVTRQFFDMLNRADEGFIDHVLNEFLKALNRNTQWIMGIPAIFADVTETGAQLAESKSYYGTTYFRILGEGGFGRSPEQVRNLMTRLKRLIPIDPDLAMSFLKGYAWLIECLGPVEVDRFIEQGLQVYDRNKSSSLRFMAGTLKSSEAIRDSLSRECRLDDIKPHLTRLMRALVGWEIEVGDLGQLDSDDLVERGSRVVCLYKWLYLPAGVNAFPERRSNREWLLLSSVVSAAMLAEGGFSRVHGHPEYTTASDLVGSDPLKLNLLQICECIRIFARIRERWPGAVRLLERGIKIQYESSPPRCAAERLFFDLALASGVERTEAQQIVYDTATGAVNVFDMANRLREEWPLRVAQDYPGLAGVIMPPLAFVPDSLFPAHVSAAELNHAVIDLKDQAEHRRRKPEEDSDRAAEDQNANTDSDQPSEEEGDEDDTSVVAAYVYDEWSQPDHDYFQDFCFVREIRDDVGEASPIPPEIANRVTATRRMFEYLKPDIAKKEKHLAEGDYINPDLLIDYIVSRRREPCPTIDFYERPKVNERDLAVMILLDVSGSTGHEDEGQQTIEVEKQAALILGQGLESLGDRFSICGFSGQGREHCEFYVFKSFEDPWDHSTMSHVLKARPRTSTRIGAALRHAGFRMSQVEAKKRLIILITDGKPMDSGYDPGTRYAQFDVRVACEENERQAVHTLGISTTENSRADMELMFPGRRYTILPSINDLPKVLPRLYIHMTI